MSKPNKRTITWTDATAQRWASLGHQPGCPCKKRRGQITATIGDDTWSRLWQCWRQAVARLDKLPPRDGVHATRALYAFRDRATRPPS